MIFDVAIIGAGALGTSIAFHLADDGARVVLIDQGIPGSLDQPGTTSRSFGLVWVQSKTPRPYLELSLASAQAYPHYLEQLGDDCAYRRTGGMTWIDSDEARVQLETLMAAQCEVAGFTGELLDRAAVHARVPGLGAPVQGATWSPHDGHLNPRRLVVAAAAAAGRKGVQLALQRRVAGARWQQDRFELTTGGDTVQASRLILAAGTATPAIAELIGTHVPVTPIKGHIVVTEPSPVTLPYPTPDLRQDELGRLWIGTTHEPGRRDSTVDTALVALIRRRTALLYPPSANLEVQECWSGVRPVPPDGHPILDRLPVAGDAYVAVGHSGITLSPLVGRLMSGLVLRGERHPVMAPFTLDRFGTSVAN